MATIEDTVSALILEVFRLPEDEKRLPVRALWIASAFWNEFDSEQRLHVESKEFGARSIGEHMEQALADMRCSERPSCGDLRRMMPTKNGVWSLHAAGSRIYGWVPRPNAFVAVTFALERDTKSDKSLNDRKLKQVLMFIKANHLEKAVLLGDISAVFPT